MVGDSYETENEYFSNEIIAFKATTDKSIDDDVLVLGPRIGGGTKYWDSAFAQICPAGEYVVFGANISDINSEGGNRYIPDQGADHLGDPGGAFKLNRVRAVAERL